MAQSMARPRTLYGDGRYCALPRLQRTDIWYQWISDYWDRPLSGLALYRGQTCWFELVGESVTRDGRVYDDYVVVRLLPEQVADEESWHRLFQRHVGRHWDFDEDGQRYGRPAAAHASLQPRDSWHLYYEMAKGREEPDYSYNPAIGWYAIDQTPEAASVDP